MSKKVNLKPVPKSATLEWDEDEFELPAPSKETSTGQPDSTVPTPSKPAVALIRQPGGYAVEFIVVVFLVFYGGNFLYGRAYNSCVAKKWSQQFASDGGVFDKNFSLIGSGEADAEPVMRESASLFKFYASGRRYCQGLLATLNMRARQDVLSLVYYLIDPREDVMEVEVYMNEVNMPHTVLTVAVPKVARVIQRNCKDVSGFAKQVTVAKDKLASWPHDKLVVYAEHSSVFYDVFSDTRLQQLFAAEGPYKSNFKYFRSMHVTSENSEGSYKRVLKFTYALPPPGEMASLAILVALIPMMIDFVGTYKLSPEAQKKAIEARAKLQELAFKETLQSRKDALQQKKAEKFKDEKDRIAKLEAKAKRKSMKMKVVRC